MIFATCIIYTMAVSYKVGRPYQMADIDFTKDPDQELYDSFYAACDKLHYFDTVVLSRALGVHVVTVRRWKAHQTFPPGRGIAQQIIDWVNMGKPRKVVTRVQASPRML